MKFWVLSTRVIRGIRGEIFSAFSRHPNYQSHVEEQQRRGEEQTVQKIERAADSGEQISRILYVRAALNDRFSQVAEHRGESKKQPEHCCVRPSQRRQMARH